LLFLYSVHQNDGDAIVFDALDLSLIVVKDQSLIDLFDGLGSEPDIGLAT
jgi:hypothetical protein